MALPATVPHQNLQSGAGILSSSKGFVASSAERCLRSEVTVPTAILRAARWGASREAHPTVLGTDPAGARPIAPEITMPRYCPSFAPVL
jgi:hypothetical protein